MPYRDYLRLDGSCSVVLGLALAIVAFPGLVISYGYAWVGPLFVPATLLALALNGRLRHGASLWRPGEWLTAGPLAGAQGRRRSMPARPVVRRVVLEAAGWVVGVTAWVLWAGSSGLLIFGTGLASAAYGLVEAVAARRRVAAVEESEERRYLLAERRGLGTPVLAVRRLTEVAPERRGQARSAGAH